ncbi:hypothetical protein Tco_0193993 [Tanacetum coccineum]
MTSSPMTLATIEGATAYPHSDIKNLLIRSGTLVAAKGLVDSIEVCYKSLGRSMELKVEYPFALNVRVGECSSKKNSVQKSISSENMFGVLSDGGGIERRLDWESLKDRIDGACEKGLHISRKKIQEAEEKIKKLDKEHEAIIEIFSDERSRQYDMESNLRKKWQDAMITVEELHKQIKELENNKVRTQRMINGGLGGIHVLGSLRPNPGGGGGMANGYLGIQLLGSNGGGGAGVNGGLNEGMLGCQDLSLLNYVVFECAYG